ncbi:MAG: hypothetical protein PHD95_01980 [Candidatus ainarchaeum sp.]|nr:hypothetical protein [Candidatus ainarchaeum sp.]
MKKVFSLQILLICIIVLLGCAQPVAPDDTAGLKDCGTNKECISDATKQCEKAFAVITEKSQSPEADIGLKISIFGLDGENCKISYKMEKITVDPKSKDAAIAQVMAVMLQGKSMACLVPKEELGNYDAFGAAQVKDLKKQCTGPLVDALLNVVPNR